MAAQAVSALAWVRAMPELELTTGVERQFAVNHLGHFILINQLQEPVLAAPQGRFVVLSSMAHRQAKNGIEFDNLDGSKDYVPWTAYGQSKLANALCSLELAKRIEAPLATLDEALRRVAAAEAVRVVG